MTQLSLFDNPQKQSYDETRPQLANKLARKSDPATSHKAAAAVSCGLSEVELLAVKVARNLCRHLTANEIAAQAYPLTESEKVGVVFSKRETMRKRIGELTKPAYFKDGTKRRDAWFKESGARECQVTGKEATTFEVIP